MMIEWSKHVVALTSEEEKKNDCVRRTHNYFVNYDLIKVESCILLLDLTSIAIFGSESGGAHDCILLFHDSGKFSLKQKFNTSFMAQARQNTKFVTSSAEDG
jgi:hypothetical protein